jgi:predicted RNA-binding Zn ribbon-like protein
MSTLPTWYPGEEQKPAPLPLLLVQAFLNTRDLDEGTDLLRNADAAGEWFQAVGLLGSRSSVAPDELEMARAVRESVRSLLESRDDGQGVVELGPLRDLAATRRPRLTVRDDGLLALENPRHEDLADGLFGLLLIIRSAQDDGSWSRLKACANPDCRWAFYDRSRNQQGHWCDMAVCGNRIKNRHLRARRR